METSNLIEAQLLKTRDATNVLWLEICESSLQNTIAGNLQLTWLGNLSVYGHVPQTRLYWLIDCGPKP
jgi:hypothetical protein